jgi:exodeoxyribonuclease VII small subunit
MTKKASYEKQVEELESIIEEMESGEISIDQLSAKVKRAAQLIKSCREVLENTESEVDEILKGINKDSKKTAS